MLLKLSSENLIEAVFSDFVRKIDYFFYTLPDYSSVYLGYQVVNAQGTNSLASV